MWCTHVLLLNYKHFSRNKNHLVAHVYNTNIQKRKSYLADIDCISMFFFLNPIIKIWGNEQFWILSLFRSIDNRILQELSSMIKNILRSDLWITTSIIVICSWKERIHHFGTFKEHCRRLKQKIYRIKYFYFSFVQKMLTIYN